MLTSATYMAESVHLRELAVPSAEVADPPRHSAIVCRAANSDVLIDHNRVPVWVHGNKAAGPGRILICLIH